MDSKAVLFSTRHTLSASLNLETFLHSLGAADYTEYMPVKGQRAYCTFILPESPRQATVGSCLFAP